MIEGLIGCGIGSCVSTVVLFRVHRRLCFRMHKNETLEKEKSWLERHREIVDSGLDEEELPYSGPPSDEDNLFAMHPGAMTLQHIAEKNPAENLAKVFDTSGLSASMDQVRVETDQHDNQE